MWYVVDIIFAQSPREGTRVVQCESCNVLFEAPSAINACAKAARWGAKHEKDNSFHYVGIRHLWSLDEERPDDGTEIGGAFFEEVDFWDHLDRIIPDANTIPTIKMEENPQTPFKYLISEEAIVKLKRIFNEEP